MIRLGREECQQGSHHGALHATSAAPCLQISDSTHSACCRYAQAVECSWFSDTIRWAAFVSNTMWNTLFLLYWIEVHSSNPARGRWSEQSSAFELPSLQMLDRLLSAAFCCCWMMPPDVSAPLAVCSELDPTLESPVMDAPLWMHWRKCILWLVLEGLLLSNSILSKRFGHASNFVPIPGVPCRLQPWVCHAETITTVLVSLQAACLLLYSFFYLLCGEQVEGVACWWKSKPACC